MKIITSIVLFVCVVVKAQSHYPDSGRYLEGLSSLGNLWAYVERIDKSLDSAHKKIDSLRVELYYQKKLLQFNTDISNYYIIKVDSLIRQLHRVDTGFRSY